MAAREPGSDGAALPADMAALADLIAAHWASRDGAGRLVREMEPREACGCLIRNVEVFGHRPDCRNYPSL